MEITIAKLTLAFSLLLYCELSTVIFFSVKKLLLITRSSRRKGLELGDLMEKTFTLLQTVAASGVFSAVSFWYGFMFGRESSRKQLGSLIDDLRKGNPIDSTPRDS